MTITMLPTTLKRLFDAPDETTASVEVRQVCAGLMLLLTATLVAHFLPDSLAVTAALKVVVGALALGLAPGVAIVLFFKPLSRLSLFPLLGIGITISLILSQLASFVSILFHVAVSYSAWGIVLLTAGMVAFIYLRRRADEPLVIERMEIVLGIAVLILAILLYWQGSPAVLGEDLIHISVIRRLISVPSPSLTDIYYSPGTIYTYVFPGIHTYVAMATIAGGTDPFFSYQKLRFFWGIAAILLLIIASRQVFGDARVALITGIVAICFVVSGTFAWVTYRVYFWAQLAPFSHASDVAMNVLLPGLLVSTFYYLLSESRSEYLFFLVISLAMTLMLTVVHIRETVQFLVYLVTFIAMLVFIPEHKLYLRRAAILLGLTLIIVIPYFLWYQATVGHIDVTVATHKTELLNQIRGYRLIDLLSVPSAQLQAHFITLLESWGYGWFAPALVTTAICLTVFRRRALAIFCFASILVYLLIVRFPLLSIPFIYATYEEILFTPVRNVAFFLYLGTGTTIWLIIALTKTKSLNRWVVMLLLLACIVCVYLLWSDGVDLVNNHATIYFTAAVLLYVGGMAVIVWPKASAWADSWLFPDQGHVELYPGTALVVILVLGLLTANTSGFLTASIQTGATPEQALSERLVCQRPTNCAASSTLVSWLRTELPPDAVLCTNYLNAYMPSVDAPQQVLIWPVSGHQLESWELVFNHYYEGFKAYHININAMKQKQQPFFGSAQTQQQRIDFVRASGATHCLVDPMYYSHLMPVLAQRADIFKVLYDDSQWAVVKVNVR